MADALGVGAGVAGYLEPEESGSRIRWQVLRNVGVQLNKVQSLWGSQGQGCHASPAFVPWWVGDTEALLGPVPEQGCVRCSRSSPPPTLGTWHSLPPTLGTWHSPPPTLGTWHTDSIDVHLLQEVQGLQDFRHFRSGHILPLPPVEDRDERRRVKGLEFC